MVHFILNLFYYNYNCIKKYSVNWTLRHFNRNAKLHKATQLIEHLCSNFLYLSHSWFATVQEVLQADWQEVWHSPHPPFSALCFKVAPDKVLMCFFSMTIPPFPLCYTDYIIKWHYEELYLKLTPKTPPIPPAAVIRRILYNIVDSNTKLSWTRKTVKNTHTMYIRPTNRP